MSGSLSIVQAQTAASFDASIGINVHPPYSGTPYANQSLWLPLLESAGFAHVRTNWDENQPAMDSQVEQLASAGIKVLITSDALYSEGETPQSLVNYLVAHPQLAASIYQIAGPNEINANFSNWQTGIVPFIKSLYMAIKANPVTAHIQIVAPNFDNMQYDQSLATQLGNISQYVDIGDIHGTNGGDAANDAYFAQAKQTATTMSGTKPLINTEGGYSYGTDSYGHNIPLPVDAVQVDVLRYYFDDFAAGIQSSDLYQMMRMAFGDTVWGDDFYLINDDGTPTPVYNEIKATTALLQNNGTPLAKPGSLTYSLNGTDSSTKTILLQKSDDTFWLAYWEDKQYYEYSVGDSYKGYTKVGPMLLTLQLGSPATGALFNPYSGSTAAVSKFSNATSISLSMTTIPQLIEIVPASAAATPVPIAHPGITVVGHGQTVNLAGTINGLITPGSPGDTETVTAVSATKGTASLGSNGAITYITPASGSDTITYTVTDQHGGSASGNVAVTVDTGPAAGTLTVTINLGNSMNLTTSILNVVTPCLKGDRITLTSDGTSGTLGTVSLTNGQLIYTAAGSTLKNIPANGKIADSFTYTVSDQYGDTATGTVNLSITSQTTVINGPQGGNGTIQAVTGNSIVNAFGMNNFIYDNGGNDIVNAGQGLATVYVNTGSVVVNLNGTGNVVTGFDRLGSAAITGSDGNVSVSGSQGTTVVNLGNGQNSVTLGGTNNTIKLGNGNNNLSAGTGNATVNLGSGNNQITLGGFLNTVVAGNGSNQISGSQGLTNVTLGSGADTVSLAGFSNSIKVGDGQDTITAGAGFDQVTTGSGNDTITLQGQANTVNLGFGTDTVHAADGDTITVNGTNLRLQGGTQEMVFLGAGKATVDDLSNMTTVIANSTSGSASILDVVRDPGFVLDLKGGVGGYTSAAAIVSALKSDIYGGTMLPLGVAAGSPVIDFIKTAASLLTTAHFKIG